MSSENVDKNNIFKIIFFVSLVLLAGVVGKYIYDERQQEKTDETVVTVDTAKPKVNDVKPDSPNIKVENKPEKTKKNYFAVSGSDLAELRDKLSRTSINALSSGRYTPTNVKLSLSSKVVTFDLIEQPSDFIKLSLLFGPINIGCESCQSALQKNPGSIVMTTKSNSEFEVQVIAISK